MLRGNVLPLRCSLLSGDTDPIPTLPEGMLYMSLPSTNQSEPVLAPSDSTIIYRYELNESGVLTIWANSGVDYFTDNLGVATHGSVHFYNGNSWIQSWFERDFIPINESIRFQRPLSIINHSNEPNNMAVNTLEPNTEQIKKKIKDRKLKDSSGPNIQFWGIEQYSAITPLEKSGALFAENRVGNTSSLNDTRSQDITISLTVDSYPGEASWNFYDYSNNCTIYIW